MTDVLEQKLREALTEQAAQMNHGASARLRAVDYHPRRRRIPTRPAIGVTGLAGVAAAVGAVVALGSSAAPAFAGWQATPTSPAPGQLAQAAQACGSVAGTPVLTDTRGPYAASIYVDAAGDTATCLTADGVSLASSSLAQTGATVAAGQVQLEGTGVQDSAGDALTLVDGRIGAGVTAVTIERSDGSSVQATVGNGWYLAWWPGTATATTAEVMTASGMADQTFPQGSAPAAPSCPTGARCAHGYSFGSGRAVGAAGSTRITSGSVGAGQSSTVAGNSGSGVPQAGTQTTSGQ
jgi:hypothetical protein